MDYNYHTHTVRCHHAKGEPEDYIKRAIACGIQYMGFSEHAPFRFSDGSETRHRVPCAEVSDYFAELDFLRRKYKDEITIHIGFEMEYYPTLFSEMLQYVLESGAEYLLLGQHYSAPEYTGVQHTNKETKDEKDLRAYVETVIEGMQSGVFSYLAHPDMLRYTGDMDLYRREMRKICVAAREANMPIEINCLGIRDNRNYPNEAFWEIAGEEKASVTIGFDAHTVESAFDGESVIKAKEMIAKYRLNYIGRPSLRLLQKGTENEG